MKIIGNYCLYFDLNEASSPFQQMKTIYAFKDSQPILNHVDLKFTERL